MNKIISTPKAPKAIGPYSQAIVSGSYIFTSGQLGIDPSNGKLLDTVEEQTTQVMKNLTAVLTEAGSDLSKVVKSMIFLSDLTYFDAVNKIYEAAFVSGNYPARSCVQVARLPKDAAVEIEVIATL